MIEAREWSGLREALRGDLQVDNLSKIAYSTDASIYRRIPLGVAFPANVKDMQILVKFALKHQIGVIPRAAGTSLAGQCVGEGLVVDVSKYMTSILEFDQNNDWIEVEPGVIRDELNRYLAPFGLFFGPNTSTSSRCMIGGMVGNNSCGTTSIKYGSTREKLMELEVVLSNGTIARIKSRDDLRAVVSDTQNAYLLEIQEQLHALLIDQAVQDEINEHFPKKSIKRRNTGYALDEIISQQPFQQNGDSSNLCKLLAGSEGTLCFISKIRLKLDKLPPQKEAVLCAHFDTLKSAMEATVLAMKFEPFACELMDRNILELTKGNIEQAENRFFVEGDPAAVIAIELRSEDQTSLDRSVAQIIEAFRKQGMGYAFPVVYPPQTKNIWDLRAAGLGVLSNMPGDAKPVAFVEDTAVDLQDLPAYVSEFEALMTSFGQTAVYYAHAGAGELHLRPVINLKTQKGQLDLLAIAKASATLVKKFGGSLSGEHGDGRVRSPFLELMVGPKNYEIIKKVKNIWDPHNIFNPGKIVHSQPVDKDLRYTAGQHRFSWNTFFDFGSAENMLQSAERCNGSGDCRKLATSGATMCPSYQATKDEIHSTRARANVLREIMSKPKNPAYPLDSDEVKEVLDLCLSCKACKKECPSSVDMATLKAEAMYHYHRRHGYSRSDKFFGLYHQYAKWGRAFAPIVNVALTVPFVESTMKTYFGIADKRSIPPFSYCTGSRLAKKFAKKSKRLDLVLYIDEFTQYQDAHLAKSSALLLTALGYSFVVIYAPSGRAALSKALLPVAQECAEGVLDLLKPYLNKQIPIVGIEPSAVLGFRDEYLKLTRDGSKDLAKHLAAQSLTMEEFLYREHTAGKIDRSLFTAEEKQVHVHLHCHQKALSRVVCSKSVLQIPKNYDVQIIPSGCCGMAGSFGYEDAHYGVSNQIAELVLFPHIRKNPDVIIAAAGTSCRHQIKDGLGQQALHPVQILAEALK